MSEMTCRECGRVGSPETFTLNYGHRTPLCKAPNGCANGRTVEEARKVVEKYSTVSDQSAAAAREQCHAQSDGDCSWEHCPQLRDGEPKKSGRHCPLDVDEEDEEADWLDEYIADAQQDRREITDINCYAMGNADGRLEAAHTFRAKLRAASRQSGAAPSTAPTRDKILCPYCRNEFGISGNRRTGAVSDDRGQIGR